MTEIDKQTLDECIKNNIPYTIVDFDFPDENKNPDYIPDNSLEDTEWIKSLYTNILILTPDDNDEGFLYWLNELSSGKKTRENVLAYFKNVAIKENNKQSSIKFEDIFDKNGKKRILFVIKQSIGDCFICTSLFESIKENYIHHDLYVATEPKYFSIFQGNPHVHRCIPYNEIMENELAMIGQGDIKGFVDVYMNPAVGSQRQLNYLSNSKIALNFK